MRGNHERWIGLCEEAFVEQDYEKQEALITEIVRLLGEKLDQLAQARKNRAKDGRP